jgi:hypothetical protein
MHFHGGVWAFYIIGQVLHVLGSTSDAILNKTIPGVSSYREYVRRYGIAIATRFFLLICVFPYVVDNPSEFDISGIAHGPVHAAFLSGIVGYFFDSFADRAFSLLGIKQKLPALPGIPPDAPAAPPAK